MRRREFFSFASGAAAIPATALIGDTGDPGIGELTAKLRDAIKSDLPGITKIEITYDPEDTKVPLMVLAFRT